MATNKLKSAIKRFLKRIWSMIAIPEPKDNDDPLWPFITRKVYP